MDTKNALTETLIRKKVNDWLEEDIPSFDFAGFVVGDNKESAVLLCKSEGVLAGVPFFDCVFAELGCTVQWFYKEGDFLTPVTRVAVVEGAVRKILAGERVALNCLCRASGVATVSKRLKDKAAAVGWQGTVAGNLIFD